VTILTRAGVEESARGADVLVAPAVGDVDLLDFAAKDRAIAAGAAAAREKLPEIRNAVDGWKPDATSEKIRAGIRPH
jgi:predicted acylesterase/phospholipase RssA